MVFTEDELKYFGISQEIDEIRRDILLDGEDMFENYI